MVETKQVWQAVLGELQLHVTRPSYVTWLKDTVGVSCRDGVLVVGTPNAFVSEMLERRMYSLISRTVEKVAREPMEVRFQVVSRGGAFDPAVLPPTETSNGTGTGHTAEPQPQAPGSTANGRRIPLNPRYTFESFIVGKSNELSHAAALAVTDRPGSTYNPLVIYSDVGLGKTHLLHAIGQRARSRGMSLIYATAEEFTNEYIKAIRDGKTEEFRDRYRNAEMLLMDDLQFLIGKEQTQEGFFHTFNALHMNNRQIVITSDRPVTSLTLLEDRVRSRLGGGLVVDIQPPDLETRLAILQAKADALRQEVDALVIQHLAQRMHKNIRDLEGSLNRMAAYADLTSQPITIDLLEPAQAHSSPANGRPSALAIVQATAAFFSIDRPALEGPRGTKTVATARQVAMYLLREEAGLGPTAIGRLLGGRHHATVIRNCAKMAALANSDQDLQSSIQHIKTAAALA